MLRAWKKEFIENAGRVFNERQAEKEIRRKEAALEKEKGQMLKTIGQLTLERDFLQDCFRQCGQPIPDTDRFKRWAFCEASVWTDRAQSLHPLLSS